MRKLILLVLIILLSACKKHGRFYNGYIDADLVYLSSNYAGRLNQLFVHRGESVQKDRPLFKLEQTREYFSVAMSKYMQHNLDAQRKALMDQIQYAETNYQRIIKMRKGDAASQNDLDVAKKDLDVLKEQLASINFQIASNYVDTADKNWQVQRKENAAHDAGIIFDTYFTEHEYVQAGQPVLSLITQKNIKVVFFVPEKELNQIQLNQKVKITSDENPKLATGFINYIANIAQYTPPIIYSREERQDLVFRVEAHVDAANLRLLHLGQPVSLELEG